MKILINRWKSWNRKITILTTVYKEIPLKTGRNFLSTKKLSMKKSWKNIFSSNIKNRYLELKHIQRRASDSFSKYSNMSIVYFLQFDQFQYQIFACENCNFLVSTFSLDLRFSLCFFLKMWKFQFNVTFFSENIFSKF